MTFRDAFGVSEGEGARREGNEQRALGKKKNARGVLVSKEVSGHRQVKKGRDQREFIS